MQNYLKLMMTNFGVVREEVITFFGCQRQSRGFGIFLPSMVVSYLDCDGEVKQCLKASSKLACWPTREAAEEFFDNWIHYGDIMKNQHEKIKGYRDLSQEEIDLMNEGKNLAEKCGEFITKLEANAETDKRNVALGKTNLQQGFMWAIRGVAKPTTF